MPTTPGSSAPAYGKSVNGPYTIASLNNGLRIVVEQMPDVRSAAAGFLVRTGARDEVRPLAGVSHFLEHMMFKGTSKRTWREITVDFDRLGSSYNAFTSEDRTVYYGWVRSGDIAPQMEILADMMRSTIPQEEFDTEKKVILEEIAMSRDHLEHVAFDFLQERVFAGNSLAWPILGYHDTVGALSRDDMWSYFERRYAPNNMVLIVAGHVDPDEVIRTADKLCGGWAAKPDQSPRSRPRVLPGADSLVLNRFKQQIVALTFDSVGASDELAETADAAAAILGGENSRFFWNIVQTGLSSRAGAFHLDYTDCGVIILSGSCPPDGAERLLEAMRVEAKRMCEEKVADHEVERVKNRRRTSLALEAEAPYYRLTQIIDDMEFYGAPRTVEQMLAAVDAITSDRIREYFQRYPIDRGGHLATVGPRAWPGANVVNEN